MTTTAKTTAKAYETIKAAAREALYVEGYRSLRLVEKTSDGWKAIVDVAYEGTRVYSLGKSVKAALARLEELS